MASEALCRERMAREKEKMDLSCQRIGPGLVKLEIQKAARTDGEITVVKPDGEEAMVIDIDLSVDAMRKRLEEPESADATRSASCRASRRRVPQSLIDVSPEAITPEMVSIGPFHHGKVLPESESSKLWFLNQLLSRLKRDDGADHLGDLFKAMQRLENSARAFYDEDVLMSSLEFIQMMVLDGCFIIELFRHLGPNEDVSGHDDPISTKPWLIPIITRDLLKLENQLPFFVLQELFRVTATAADVGDPLALLALKFFNLSLPRPNDEIFKRIAKDDYSHLLGLFHCSFCSPLYTNEKYQPSPFRRIPVEIPTSLAFPQLPKQSKDHRVSLLRYWSVSIPIFCLRWSVSTIFYCLGWSIAILRFLYNILSYCLRWIVSLTLPDSEEYRHPVLSIQSTTQLRPSGVKFKTNEAADSFLEINFKNRVLQIPPITINDLTITLFINCIAYEQCYYNRFTSGGQGCFTHYIAFLSCLINSPKDVAFLCAKGIIASYSYNDYYIAGMLNKLGRKVYFNRNTCGYLDGVFRAVEAYYNSHWGTFMRTYFSTPWSFISIVSAVILLVLTGAQTVLAVLSYIDQRGKQL